MAEQRLLAAVESGALDEVQHALRDAPPAVLTAVDFVGLNDFAVHNSLGIAVSSRTAVM